MRSGWIVVDEGAKYVNSRFGKPKNENDKRGFRRPPMPRRTSMAAKFVSSVRIYIVAH